MKKSLLYPMEEELIDDTKLFNLMPFDEGKEVFKSYKEIYTFLKREFPLFHVFTQFLIISSCV